MKHYFSFGWGHAHNIGGVTYDRDCLVEIEAPDSRTARERMVERFGTKWGMQYTAAELPGIRHYFTRGIFTLVLALSLLTGCASVSHQRYSLTPGPNECQFTESRTFLTALGSVVCWDRDERPIGMAGGPGTSPASITMSAISSAATVAGPVAGAVILGGKVVEAARVLDGATLNTVTSGSVTATGSVTGTLAVPPVTGTLQLLPPVTP